jgi:integrase
MICVSATMKQILEKYRNTITFVSDVDYLFHGYDGRPYPYETVNHIFRQVLVRAGIAPRASGKYPRIHDLRHVMAIRALEQMEQKGYDLYSSLPLLSKYLGHKTIIETEYYIRLTQSSFSRITAAADSYSPDLFPRLDGDHYE